MLRQENAELIEAQASANRYIRELEKSIKGLESELKTKADKLEGEFSNQDPMNKLKKLCTLKKAIRETGKAEMEMGLQNVAQECEGLRKAYSNLKAEIEEVKHELEFKKMIIRNYENASSLPSAK